MEVVARIENGRGVMEKMRGAVSNQPKKKWQQAVKTETWAGRADKIAGAVPREVGWKPRDRRIDDTPFRQPE